MSSQSVLRRLGVQLRVKGAEEEPPAWRAHGQHEEWGLKIVSSRSHGRQWEIHATHFWNGGDDAVLDCQRHYCPEEGETVAGPCQLHILSSVDDQEDDSAFLGQRLTSWDQSNSRVLFQVFRGSVGEL